MQQTNTRRLLLGSIAAAAAALLAPVAHAQTQPAKSVAVTALVDHPALDAVRKGVEDELKAQGWIAGKNLKYQYQSAQGNTATTSQIARKFVGDKPDVIVPIATSSAQAVAAATNSIPIVFSAVLDPVAAKLVKDLKAPGGNVTGVSHRLPMETQVDLILKVMPTAKRVGSVYSPGEINSTITLTDLKGKLAQRGMTLVEAAAPRTTDNNVVSAFESVAKVAADAKLPIVAADSGTVKRGAIAAFGVDYYDLGRQTGQMVVRILKGAKPKDTPVETGRKTVLEINAKAAREQGIKLSDSFLKEGKIVVP